MPSVVSDLNFINSAKLLLNGSAGTAGQVLTSNGPGSPATWSASAAGNATELQYRNAGVLGGVAGSSVDGSGNITLGTRLTNALNGAASAPPVSLTGTWFTGGTSTTTKPAFLIEPAGTASTSWSTAGTGLGVNAPSGFGGDLAWLGVAGTKAFGVDSAGRVLVGINNSAVPSSSFSLLHVINGNIKVGLWDAPTSGSNVTISAGLGSSASPSLGRLIFTGYNEIVKARISSSDISQTNSNQGDLRFEIQTGATSYTEVMRFDITGTKIGTATTQKLGFFGATPIVQPAAANQAALTNSTGGTADGTLAAVGNTSTADQSGVINDNFTEIFRLQNEMRTALVNLGLIKGAA